MNQLLVTERKYLMNGASEEYTPLSAFPYNGGIRFELAFPADVTPSTVVLRVHADSDGSMKLFTMYEVRPHVWSVTVDLSSLCGKAPSGLFFYCFDAYLPERCATLGTDESDVLRECGEGDKRQLLVYASDYTTPEWLRGGILYHVFVDRFASSGRCPVKPGAVLNPDWDHGTPAFPAKNGDEFENNEFFGGDLWGVASKLDYIRTLGVTCLYLSPIFESPSNHKYDTGDYERVDSMFGGEEALKHLLAEAEKRGMRVILDGVFNHTGADSRYFNKFGRYDTVGAYQSKKSLYASWYTFRKWPDDYECWWNVKILPRVNCDDASYRRFLLGNGDGEGVIAHWMKLGVSGWRLDVADELSSGFLEALRARVREVDPEAMIYGEVWEDATNKVSYSRRRAYLSGAQLDSVMNYPLRDAVIAYVRNGDAAALKRCVHTIYTHYSKPAADTLMNFLGTHDTMRIMTALGGPSPEGKTNAQLSAAHMSGETRQKALMLVQLAYHLVSFMPGVPCIFYGDEAGVEGYGDPFCRKPFPWNAREEGLTAAYRRIGRIHRSYPVFRDGYVRLLACTEQAAVLMRYNGKDAPLMLVLNRSSAPLGVTLSVSAASLDGTERGREFRADAYSARYLLPDGEELSVNLGEWPDDPS